MLLDATRRHATYYLARVNRNKEECQTIEIELPQVRRAWVTVASEPDIVLDFVEAMRWFQGRQGLWSEYIKWLERGVVPCTTT